MRAGLAPRGSPCPPAATAAAERCRSRYPDLTAAPAPLPHSAAAAMLSTVERAQLVLRRLRRSRSADQLNAIQALRGLAATHDGRQAIFAAGSVAALLECASRSLSSGGSQAAAEQALSLLMTLCNADGSGRDAAQWRAAMQAASGVRLLVPQLGSGAGELSHYYAAMMLGALACENTPLATEALGCGAAPLLVAVLRGASCGRIHHAMLFALVELSRVPGSGDLLLRCGAVEAVVPLLISDGTSEQVQKLATWVLSNVCQQSAQRGLAVARAGGIRALARLVQRGGPIAATTAAQVLYRTVHWSPGVLAVLLAEGGIPALEAFLRAHPATTHASDAARLLTALRWAQQSGPPVDDLAAEPASSGSGSAASEPAEPDASPASPAAPAPTAARHDGSRPPHLCSWCGVEAPAGKRFKKCAVCQQAGGP